MGVSSLGVSVFDLCWHFRAAALLVSKSKLIDQPIKTEQKCIDSQSRTSKDVSDAGRFFFQN